MADESEAQYKDEVAELAGQIAAARGALAVAGGSSRSAVGERIEDAQKISSLGLSGVLAYEPSELYVTVAAGTRLAELDQVLAAEGQQLAAEIPMPPGATVGGALAVGFSGPCAPSCGRLRDHVLGASVIDGSGDVMSFGGTLIKNVAGFDVSRLLVGSFGTLGCIAKASLRVRGLPEADVTLSIECAADVAPARANEAVCAGGSAVAASAWSAGMLRLRLTGSEAAVAAARRKIGGETEADAADSFWGPLRDWSLPQQAEAKTLWLCSLPATASLEFDDSGLIEWHGARRWFFGARPAKLRDAVAQAGGSAILVRRGKELGSEPVFPSPPADVVDLQRRIKQVFDPRGIFSPGRMSYL